MLEQPRRPGLRRRAAGRCSAGALRDRARGRRTLAAPLTITSAHGRAGTAARASASGVLPAERAAASRAGVGSRPAGQRLLDVDPQSPACARASSGSGVRSSRFPVAWTTSNRSGSSARRSVSRWLRPLTETPAEANRPSKREVEPAREKRERVAEPPRGSAPASARRVAVRPDPAAIVLLGRAQGPSARPLGRSRIVVEGSRGAGQPELMFPCLEFSDVCRCRDGGPLQRVSVHTDRKLPMTSRSVPDVVSPSDNARAAGRSIV
jgi:hypothetical protein